MKKFNRNLLDLAFICLCAALALTLGVGIFLLPVKERSEQENRALAPLPSLSVSSVLDGSFFDSLSAFYSDHVPLREHMIRARAICELCLGKRETNGVIVSSDGTLTDRIEYTDTNILHKNLSAIDSFAGTNNAITVILPRSVDVRFPNFEQAASASGYCDAELLAHLRALYESGNDPYYKTDHHLNSVGILALYGHLSSPLGFAPLPVRGQKVSDSFWGSVYSKAGLIRKSADDLYLLRYANDTDVCVVCFDKSCAQDSLYSWGRLNEKDKYSVFLGGNHGLLQVYEKDGEKPSLLLIKDSFANALIPLLARHYDLTVVDPRYYEGSISELASEDFDSILVLFGTDTLATTSMAKNFLR